MFKYVFLIILGILVYLLYNRINGFSVGVPNYLFLQKHTSDELGTWEVKDTLDPTLDLSQYERRFKTTYEFSDLGDANINKWMTGSSYFRDQIVEVRDRRFCLFNPIYVDAVETLNTLNERLSRKCPRLRMVLDKPENMSNSDEINDMIETVGESIDSINLVICLYYNEECICLLTIKIRNIDNTITISITTKPIYKGNKYMSLLSCVLMLCANKLIYCNKITNIDAVCYNSITIYYIIKNYTYNTYTIDFHNNDELETEYNRITPITREKLRDLQTILDRYGAIHVIIDLTPENIARAQALFDVLLGDSDNSITCPYIIEPILSVCSVITTPLISITDLIDTEEYNRVERLYYTIVDIDVGREFTREDFNRVQDTITRMGYSNVTDIYNDILIGILTQLFGS